MKKIVIIGDLSNTNVLIDIIEEQKQYEIFGIIDCLNVGKDIGGYKVVGTKTELPEILKTNNIFGGVLAIGDNYKRKEAHENISSACENFNFISILHSSAIIGKDVFIGKGVIIMAGVVVNSMTRIGDFCILFTQSSLGHDGVLNDFSSISFGAITGGNLNLGECSNVSFGANIIENINIGDNSVVAAGSLVITNIPNNVVVSGVPSNAIKERKNANSNLSLGGFQDESLII